jgi:hypothetical protein
MMQMHVPSHLAFCEVQGGVMFLDVRRDRYFALPPVLEREFKALAARAFFADSADPTLVDRLSRIGVIATQDAVPMSRAVGQPAAASLKDMSPPALRSHLWDRLMVVGRLVATRSALRTTPLHAILEEVGVRRGARPVAALPQLIASTTQFEDARRWAPLKPVCLLDSLALLAFLSQRGLYANLVFGVIRQPFAAHCWVQAHEVVLNDRLDRVAEFTPILVV